MTTSISYAQISEQIPSPKKQIDNGAPHDVVCTYPSRPRYE